MKNTLSEVYAVVMALGIEYKNRIPNDVWDRIVVNKNDNYNPFIDENKALNEQAISKDTIKFIATLKRDYWCNTEEEREAFIAFLQENEEKLNAKIKSSHSLIERLKLLKDSR